MPGLVGRNSPIEVRRIHRCSDRRSGPPLTETRCVFSLKKTDGVGFEPTNDFRRCRFSRSAKALRALPKRTPRKTEARRPRGPRQRATDTLAQRPEPSQTEPPQAKSRPLAREVSDKSRLVCLEMAEERDSPTLPCSVREGLGSGTAGR